MVCVRDYGLRIFLFGWLLCKVGCLIWVFSSHRTLKTICEDMCRFVTICGGEELEGVVYSHHVLKVCFVALVVFMQFLEFYGIVYVISCYFAYIVSMSCFFRWFE